jgi:hypothetical protein
MSRLSRFFSLAPFAARRFRTADAVVVTQQADTAILLDLRNGRYYTLNPVGALVWSMFTAGASLESATARVKDEFDAPAEQLTSDVERFVKHLVTAKLIRRDG